jgi:hypothetical protein
MIWTVILKNGEKMRFHGSYDTVPTLLLLERQGVTRADIVALVRGDVVNRTVIPA